jgi:hypothetical protein
MFTKKLIRLSIIAGLFSLPINAYRAKNFNCEFPSNHGVLKFNWTNNSDPQDNRITSFSYSDSKNVLLASSAYVSSQKKLSAEVFQPSGAILSPKRFPITRIEMQLPSNLEVTRRQTGGYYAPIYTFYPVKFSTQVISFSMNGEVLTSNRVECSGN